MSDISVGIDLGTTNSTISTCWPEGQPRLVREKDGSGLIPSIVSFSDSGEVFVGRSAKQRMLVDVENTFYSLKRFIGKDMRKDVNRWAASQFPFRLTAGENGIPLVETRGKKIPVYQISGMVLKHLKEMAERSIGQKVTGAVITVPANFNESQRKATRQAGEYAGLNVMRIFNEPTAAALAYGLGKEEKEIVAVYDFGGGTFDITILRLEEPIFEVLSTAGDMMLGGDDFDKLVLQDMLEQFEQQYGFSPEEGSTLMQRFLFGAERMKCQLSDWIVTAFEDRHIEDLDGKPLKPFHYELTRDRFEKITQSLGKRSIEVCEKAIEMAGVSPSDISQVILVGGTTRIPFIRKMVEEFFGKPPLDRIQPDVVVSIGAAIQAFSLAGGQTLYPATFEDMLPTVVRRSIAGVKDEEELEEIEESDLEEIDEIEQVPTRADSSPFVRDEEDIPTIASRTNSQSIPVPAPVGGDRDIHDDEMAVTKVVRKSSIPPPLPKPPGEGEGLEDEGSKIDLLQIGEDEQEQEVESGGDAPPPVTPDTLVEPYIPKDVVDQLEEAERREREEEEMGQITSAGVSVESRVEVQEPQKQSARPPLLLDVTPSTLGVATVGGYMEVIIEKNSPVPVEKTHVFTTSVDYQDKVVVKILEGESKRASENNELGYIELLDIRPAPRGEVKIEVTFDVSVDGILEISAKNLETGRAQKTRLTLFGT